MLRLKPIGYIKGDLVTVRSIRDIAAAARGRRRELGLNQADLADRAGMSRKWISEFEAGKPTAELGLVLRLLAALDLQLDVHAADASRLPSRSGADVDL